MPQLHARPPTRVLSTTAVTDDQAHDLLSSYLALTESKPHLHPDADLFTDGPHFSTHGPQGGIILHLLRRVEAGLRGEILAPESTKEALASFEEEAEAVEPEPAPVQNCKKRKKLDETQLDWEDPEEYQREQDDETDVAALGDMTDGGEVEVGGGSNGVVPEVIVDDDEEPGRPRQVEDYGETRVEEKRGLEKAEKLKRKLRKKKSKSKQDE
jgi:hypothetical protein